MQSYNKPGPERAGAPLKFLKLARTLVSNFQHYFSARNYPRITLETRKPLVYQPDHKKFNFLNFLEKSYDGENLFSLQNYFFPAEISYESKGVHSTKWKFSKEPKKLKSYFPQSLRNLIGFIESKVTKKISKTKNWKNVLRKLFSEVFSEKFSSFG